MIPEYLYVFRFLPSRILSIPPLAFKFLFIFQVLFFCKASADCVFSLHAPWLSALILQVPNKYLLNKCITKGRILLWLKVAQLICRESIQKNLGGTNFIGGQGEIPTTESEDNVLVINDEKGY